MKAIFFLTILAAFFASSCRSTRKIQTVITPKDSTNIKSDAQRSHEDTLRFIAETYRSIQQNHISFNTFSAKIEVDYEDGEKKYDLTAHVRMSKDSVMWISIRAILGIEALRAIITPDSVKVLDKQNNSYTARSVAYLQEVTALPLTLVSLQDLILGNPVFLDSNIVSYTQSDDAITLLNIGSFFKNLYSVSKMDKLAQNAKLDDIDELRNRTCFLNYSNYENKKGVNFATKRRITVAEKKKIDIKMDFKQYDFNETLSFPFSVPKNYKWN